jgi:hypothetical protein
MGDLRRWQLQNVKKEKAGEWTHRQRERDRDRESEERYFTLIYMVLFWNNM